MSSPNRITGNSLANTLEGAAGADTLFGVAGNDILDSGLGNDFLTGRLWRDTLTVALTRMYLTSTAKLNRSEVPIAIRFSTSIVLRATRSIYPPSTPTPFQLRQRQVQVHRHGEVQGWWWRAPLLGSHHPGRHQRRQGRRLRNQDEPRHFSEQRLPPLRPSSLLWIPACAKMVVGCAKLR
jgi:hypothetical protein